MWGDALMVDPKTQKRSYFLNPGHHLGKQGQTEQVALEVENYGDFPR